MTAHLPEEEATDAMAECPHLRSCSVLTRAAAKAPLLARIYRNTFCSEGGLVCGRRMVADRLGCENVPSGLSPSQMGRAKRLLADG